MLKGKKIIVVLPAYNAGKTLEQTYAEIPQDIVDDILLVDDCSSDDTVAVAKKLGIRVVIHQKNRGYGGNQKTCYSEALKTDADIIIMLHPDYQYPPKLITAMAGLLVSELFDVVLGSRILGKSALTGGMPRYKYIANRFLTFVENILIGQKLSEYHTGYRAFSKKVLETLPLLENSDDFVFDNQILVQAACFHFRFGEISSPAHYFKEASSINFISSVFYGIGVLVTAMQLLLHRLFGLHFLIFDPHGKKIQ